jgi:uncharacterized protein (DUF1800 family)
LSRRDFLRAAGLAAVGLSLGLPNIRWSGARPVYAAETAAALHMLNRLTFAARVGDLAEIDARGLEGWLEWQLAPEEIADPVMALINVAMPLLAADYTALKEAAVEDGGYTASVHLTWARVLRAAFSPRQLYEVMVEFWTDHFNVPAGDFILDKVIDDRTVIRKHALGRFRDLLFASAQSPAMLYYLNQDTSSAEHPNENYAREVMELHTLGVDGGYTETDVKELARALTGWTVRDGAPPGRFAFVPSMHDSEEKTVLGLRLPAGRGVEDGMEVLDMLARHPSTARFIAFKLCRRLVSDTPPESLVASAAQVFLDTEGDIKAILRHIVKSAEFAASAGQKFRRPIDYLAALMRITGAEFPDVWLPLYLLEMLGQTPFGWRPPNGYPDVAGAWISTTGLLGRWNMALLLPSAANGETDQLKVDLLPHAAAATTAGELVDAAIALVLPGAAIAPADREQLIAFASDGGGPDMAIDDSYRADRFPALVALLFASPYFQWR